MLLQWALWDEVVLRREKIAQSRWYGKEAEGRKYNMQTRKWEEVAASVGRSRATRRR